MQTITGTFRASGASNVVPTQAFSVVERLPRSQPGLVLLSAEADGNGQFSIQLRAGAYFLKAGSDLIPFRVKETSGTTEFGNLIEL